MFGERLKAARRMAGLTQRALAEQVGVSAMAISKYERGLDMPGSPVLIRLAQALNVTIAYFLRPQQVSLGAPAFRKRQAMPKRAQQALLAQVGEWLERYLDVEALFPDEALRFSLPAGWPRTIGALDEVEEAAVALRSAWSLGLDPLENVAELLEDLGIKVGVFPAHDAFDALTLQANGEMPVMVVRAGLSGDRERFSLAHELGHIVLRPEDGLDEERLAHRFAGAFLAPQPVVFRELGRRRRTLGLGELHLLKHKYGLSMQAWIFRARDLGILSENAAVQMFRDFRQRGWHRQEPGDEVPFEYPHRMKRLVIRAYAEGLVSAARAEELFGGPLPVFGQFQGELNETLPAVFGD